MGLFKSLEKLTKATVGTVMLPVDIVRDFGRVISDRDPRHTQRRTRKIADNVEEALEGIDE